MGLSRVFGKTQRVLGRAVAMVELIETHEDYKAKEDNRAYSRIANISIHLYDNGRV
jgi:hypothetical protein